MQDAYRNPHLLEAKSWKEPLVRLRRNLLKAARETNKCDPTRIGVRYMSNPVIKKLEGVGVLNSGGSFLGCWCKNKPVLVQKLTIGQIRTIFF
jgi:hypothetical protein